MAYSDPLDPTTPGPDSYVHEGDDRIREFKRAVIARLETVFTSVNADPLEFRQGVIPSAALEASPVLTGYEQVMGVEGWPAPDSDPHERRTDIGIGPAAASGAVVWIMPLRLTPGDKLVGVDAQGFRNTLGSTFRMLLHSITTNGTRTTHFDASSTNTAGNQVLTSGTQAIDILRTRFYALEFRLTASSVSKDEVALYGVRLTVNRNSI